MGTPDNLHPPGEQLELFPGYPEVVETTVHRCSVFAHGYLFYWYCACGSEGDPTTEGRAQAGRKRHLKAARVRAQRTTDRP
jgi:hypothetical protein